MVFTCKFNSIESIHLGTCKICLYKQVISIYRWSLEQVWLYILHCALYYHALLYHTTTHQYHEYHEYGTILLVISSFRFLKQCIHWGSPSSIRFPMGLSTFWCVFCSIRVYTAELLSLRRRLSVVCPYTPVFSETAAWIQTGNNLSAISPDHLFFFFQDFFKFLIVTFIFIFFFHFH